MKPCVTCSKPFEGHRLNDYDIVLRGDRPTVPEDICPELKNLLSKCWHQDPLLRPLFGTSRRLILNILTVRLVGNPMGSARGSSLSILPLFYHRNLWDCDQAILHHLKGDTLRGSHPHFFWKHCIFGKKPSREFQDLGTTWSFLRKLILWAWHD